MLDPLVDNLAAEEETKGKLKELNRLPEFGVNEATGLHIDLGKKRVTTRWDLDHRKEGFVAGEFKCEETMKDVRAKHDSEH